MDYETSKVSPIVALDVVRGKIDQLIYQVEALASAYEMTGSNKVSQHFFNVNVKLIELTQYIDKAICPDEEEKP